MRSFGFILLTLLAALPLAAQTVDPRAVLAVRTIDQDPAAARDLAQAAGGIAPSVVAWMILRDGSDRIEDYDSFLQAHPDWPDLDRLRARAERILPAEMSASDILDWFEGHSPQTGQGAVALAQALIAADQPQRAATVLSTTWTELTLDAEGHDAMIAAFGPLLAPFHAARTDALLWRSRREAARLMLPLLTTDDYALAHARLGYLDRADDLPARVSRVPPGLRDDAGLAYARYSWLARRGDWTAAVEMLLAQSTSAAALQDPLRWSGWRRVLARWEMREGRADQAYRLAADHFMEEGASFADLEWLAGYIALTYLGDPPTALMHFERALAVSSSPISLGRMHYWIGRVWEVKDDPARAALAYAAAAEHQTSFYGLLASEKIGRDLDDIHVSDAPSWVGDPVFEDRVVQAALLLLAADERGAAFRFLAHIGRTAAPDRVAALGAYLNHRDDQRSALLLGKSLVARGVMVPDLYFPIHAVAGLDLPVDPVLTLSIARRESEFNTQIASPAGALGLMQVMPGTAQDVAGWLDLPYSRARLTSDWEYNAQLGAAYLAYLTDEFGPSPVMIAAGYNAGPSRPRQWIDDRGDPRLREMDVIDWIEHIPFRETRNYVMRVTESMPIYRARLTGIAGPVPFTDLLIGEKPRVRPVARPER